MKNKVFFILVYKCKMFVSIVEKIYNFLFILVTVRLIIFFSNDCNCYIFKKNKKCILILFIFLFFLN